MKTTPQIDSDNRHLHGEDTGTNHRAFPLTDHAFQTPAASLGTSAFVTEKSELHSFRKVSRDFLNAEMTRDYVAEVLVFVAITGVTAWPVATVIHQLTRWMI